MSRGRTVRRGGASGRYGLSVCDACCVFFLFLRCSLDISKYEIYLNCIGMDFKPCVLLLCLDWLAAMVFEETNKLTIISYGYRDMR